MTRSTSKTRTVPVRIQRNGLKLYRGRAPVDEARRAQAAMRDEYARTGRVTGVKSARQAKGCVIHRDDVTLWMWSHFIAARELTGEQRLLLAALENAKANLTSKSEKARDEAERWFRSDDRSHLYAFATICDAFDIDPECARQGLFGE